MYWKLRAFFQNVIFKLPSKIRYDTYYYLQYLSGAFNHSAEYNLRSGVSILNHIKQNKATILEKSFLELGTGRRLSTAIALWLGGASKVITVDKNALLKESLIWQDLSHIKSDTKEVIRLFGEHAQTEIFKERIHLL